MKYAKWYFLLISRAKARDSDVVVGERHHIVPRTLDGTNEKSNLVKLTHREHFLAHWLLVKFTCGQDKRKMNCALSRMNGSNNNGRPKLTSWQYERAKVAAADAMKGTAYAKGHKMSPENKAKLLAANLGKKGQPKTAETRAKLSAAKLGNQHTKGLKHTDEARARIGAARLGRKASAETRAKISATLKGRKPTAETREKMSAARLGRKATAETRVRMSASFLGRKHTAETRAKIGAASRSRKPSAETRARMSAAKKGKPAWNKGKRKGDLYV